MNFHGFAARVIRAHGDILGLTDELRMPERGWRSRKMLELGITWRSEAEVNRALRLAKADSASDNEVIERLRQMDVPAATEFELALRADHRLDFDDLLRHAERLLGIEAIANLYRLHFPLVLLDEIQDLTEQQFRLALLIGGASMTAAGDEAQGIYRFAGAAPQTVFARLREQDPCIVRFNRSYRSAPRIVEAINAVTNELGTPPLVCADPDSWPSPGAVVFLERDNAYDEAEALLNWANGALTRDPSTSIGVIARRRTRRNALEASPQIADLAPEIWELPTHNSRIVGLLRRFVREADRTSEDPSAQVLALEAMCRRELDADEIDYLDELALACDALTDMVTAGTTLLEAVSKCRVAPPIDKPVTAGLHLLNAHVGKGQQFDWVVALGLERGQIPDFRATSTQDFMEELRALHVIVSRARVGLIVTRIRRRQDRWGRWHVEQPSPWLQLFDDVITDRW